MGDLVWGLCIISSLDMLAGRYVAFLNGVSTGTTGGSQA